MFFLHIFLAHFISAFTMVAVNSIFIQKILLWIQLMYLSLFSLMVDSQVEKGEGLFSFPEMLFFHYKLVMTMGLSVMSSREM